MSNPWIGFLRKNGGKGYSREELRDMYYQSGGGCKYNFDMKSGRNVVERFPSGAPKRERSNFNVEFNCQKVPGNKDSLGCVTTKKGECELTDVGLALVYKDLIKNKVTQRAKEYGYKFDKNALMKYMLKNKYGTPYGKGATIEDLQEAMQ